VTAIVAQPRARVAEIIDAYVGGKYERGTSTKALAAKYGVSISVVEKEAATLAHAVDYIFADRERLELEIRAELRTIRAEAARVYRAALEESDEPELQAANGALNAATKALDSIARNAGIGQPARAAVSRDEPPSADASNELGELLRAPPPWLADMLAARGWMRLESR
jgi:DNA-binding phage protein